MAYFWLGGNVRAIVIAILTLAASAGADRKPLAVIPSPSGQRGVLIAAQHGLLATFYGGTQIHLYNWGTWRSAGTLTVPDPTTYASSIAIENDYVAVGTVNFNGAPGAIYVFSTPSGRCVATLTASDGGGNSFAYTVAAWGGTIVAGNLAKGYVFVEPPGGWADATETAQLMGAGGTAAVIGPVGKNGNLVALSSGAEGYPWFINLYAEPDGGWQTTSQPSAVLTDAKGGDMGLTIGLGDGVVVTTSQIDESGHLLVFSEPKGGWRSDSTPQDVAAGLYWPSNTASVDEGGFAAVACCGSTNKKQENLARLYLKSSGWKSATNLSTAGYSKSVEGAINAGDWAFVWDYYGNVFIFNGT
jgi:hypothetical protein